MLSQLQFFVSLTACNGWLVLHSQTLWLHKTNEQLEGLGTKLRESARVFEGSEEWGQHRLLSEEESLLQ